MAISRKAKIWLIILSIPVIIIAAGIVTLKVLFTSDRLKSFLIPRIEEATQRTVTVNSMDLSLFPSLAIEVDGLAVSNAKGFSDRPMFQLDKLVLDIRLMALLKGTLEISTIALERPQIFLEVNEKGTANYSTEKPVEDKKTNEGADSASTVKIEATAGTYGLLLSNLEVNNGVLEYVDRKGNSTTSLEGVSLKVRADAPPQSSEISIETQGGVEKLSYGSLAAPMISDLRITSAQKMTYDVKKDILKLTEGAATIQEIPLNVKGEVASCMTVPVMNLVIESDKVSIPELLSLVPKEYLKNVQGIKSNGVATARIEVKGSVTDSTNPDITGAISTTNASIQYPQIPKPITNINLVADFARSRSKQEFRLSKLTAVLGNNPISITMTVRSFDDPSLTMAVNAAMNLADVKDYYPLEAGTELSGSMKANADVAGKVSNPSAMKASGTVEFRDVTLRTSTSKVHNLNGVIVFNNQVLEGKKLSMNIGKSDLSLAFSVKNYLSMMSEDKKAPKATARVTLNSNHLYTVDVMGDEKASTEQPTPQPQGRGNATQASVTTKKTQSKQKEGGLPLPNVDMDVAATIGTLTMEKFELTDVRGSINIANGVVNLQSFTGNTFGGSVSTKGKLHMQQPENPAFDLAVDMNGVDAHAVLPKFTSFGEKMFGKLSLSTTMNGKLNDTLGLVTQGLNGVGKVGLQEGKLTGVKVNQTIATMLKLPDVEEVSFKDWANMFSIADGRISIKDLRINALGADYLINGSQGLDGSLDFSMSMLLSEGTSAKVSVPGFAGEAVKLFKEPNGRVKLDFTVGGTHDDPKVGLDTKPAQQKAEALLKQKVADEAKKLEEKAKEKGVDLLKDLFKKK